MSSRSLAKGKKLLLGKKEKEVLLEESWWGGSTKREEECSRDPPAPELSAEEEITVALSPPSGHPGCARPGRTPCSQQRDLLSPPPAPVPSPSSVLVPPPPAFPSRVPPTEETAEPQHVDGTDFKPWRQGICPSRHSPHLSRA